MFSSWVVVVVLVFLAIGFSSTGTMAYFFSRDRDAARRQVMSLEARLASETKLADGLAQRLVAPGAEKLKVVGANPDTGLPMERWEEADTLSPAREAVGKLRRAKRSSPRSEPRVEADENEVDRWATEEINCSGLTDEGLEALAAAVLAEGQKRARAKKAKKAWRRRQGKKGRVKGKKGKRPGGTYIDFKGPGHVPFEDPCSSA